MIGEAPTLVGFQDLDQVQDCEFDVVVLSGSNASGGLPERIGEYGDEINFAKRHKGPLLGICFGHQLISMAFGGLVSRMQTNLTGFREVNVSILDSIFADLPEKIIVCEAHSRTVERIPINFQIIAHTAIGGIEAIRNGSGVIYGLQFHPERCSQKYPHGLRVLTNFFNIAHSWLKK